MVLISYKTLGERNLMVLIDHETLTEGDWGTVRGELVSAIGLLVDSLQRACCVPKFFLSLPKEE